MSSRIIAKVELAGYDFSKDICYLNEVAKSPEEYDEFAVGYWKNLSLLNSSGCEHDSQYINSESAVETLHMKNCPEIARFLKSTFDMSQVRMVRARNLVDGMVIPHRDFVELDSSLDYFRVFIPLEWNADAYHSDVAGVFQMRPGEVWFLDASVDHAAINFSKASRMFICLDFSSTHAFEDGQIFAKSAVTIAEGRRVHVDRPLLSGDDFADVLASIAVRLSKGEVRECVFDVAKYHFRYDVAVSSCYDWLIRGARASGELSLIQKLSDLRRFLVEERAMGERFSF